MKILLVLPAAKEFRVTPDNPSVPRRAMLRFSVLPLTTVAALTPAEHEVTLVDENVQPLNLDVQADVVGISFMTALAPRAYEIAESFRKRGIATVAGGYHPTLCPEEVAQHFDAVVVGDAEGLWPQVLRDLQAGTPQKFYRHTAPIDLAHVPIPRRDLTAGTAHHYATTQAVQVGRGCRHGCSYCSVAAFHEKTYRTRPLENVLEEIRGVSRHFMFVDDNIIADPEYAKQLFRAMIPMKKRWISQCSIKIAEDPALLRLAYLAGCRALFIGIESTSPANLEAVNKGFNDPQGYQTRLAAIRQAGIAIQAGIIVGMDHDDPGVFERTLKFLDVHHISAIQLNIMTPLPGTPMYERFEAEGRIIDRDWSHYDFFHTVIQPRGMTPPQLQAGAEWMYAQFYRLDRIAKRAWHALWHMGPLTAYLVWRIGLTYRWDCRTQGIVGYNPARFARTSRSRAIPLPLLEIRGS